MIVKKEKIVAYLLNPLHPVGGSKAAFFIWHGFRTVEWQYMAAALKRHAQENAVAQTEQTKYGKRLAVDGPLHAPDGSRLNIRTAWFININAVTPRFVTAHPLPKS